MFLLNLIRSLYKVLSSDSSPSAVAFAVSFGILAGCVPVMSGFALFMLFLVLIFRVQISAALVSWGLTRLLAKYVLVAYFERVGEMLLENDALRSFWTRVLNWPVVAWFGFEYHAIVGGAAVGLVIGALVFVPVRLLLISYRRWLHEKVSKNRFFRWLTSFWLAKLIRFVLVGTKV